MKPKPFQSLELEADVPSLVLCLVALTVLHHLLMAHLRSVLVLGRGKADYLRVVQFLLQFVLGPLQQLQQGRQLRFRFLGLGLEQVRVDVARNFNPL